MYRQLKYLVVFMLLAGTALADFRMITQKEMMPHYVHSKDYEKGFCDAWAWRSQQELWKESRKPEGFVDYIYPQLGEGNASGKLWVDCKKYEQQ